MQATTVMVIGPPRTLLPILSRNLSSACFRVVAVRPGPELVTAIRRERPLVAVIDGIDERPEAAQLEIALLKERVPEVRVIALSRRSSEADGPIIEQGVFYYAVAPTDSELIRVVHAAEHGDALRREHAR